MHVVKVETIARFMAKVSPEPNTGCWLWTAADTGWYGTFTIDGVQISAPRAAYEMFVGPIPFGRVLRHKCDVPLCVNPDHLELGTQADNIRDRDVRGRTARGGDDGNAKLTDEIVLEIRRLYAAGFSITSIGAKFRIDKSNVSFIARGKTWKHLPNACAPRGVRGRSKSCM